MAPRKPTPLPDGILETNNKNGHDSVMFYDDEEIPRGMRLLMINERILQLDDYCQRGLQEVDAACEIWRNLQTERDPGERLRILGEGEALLRDAIAVARAYSQQIPDPNKLKRFLGTGKRVNALIRLLNNLIMATFNFTQQMEDMMANCRALRRHLEKNRSICVPVRAAA
jgi:hypothetical protein